MKTSGSAGKQWLSVDIQWSGDDLDELAALVAECFPSGVEILEGVIRCYPDASARPDWRHDVQELCAAFASAHPSVPAPRFRCCWIDDASWADRWRDHFKPMRIGARLVVAPSWENAVLQPADCLVRIDPGRAFGTGHHETTRLCLEWLDGLAAPAEVSKSFLDVGTGSGILAIAAALLGFRRVVAVDIDPEAIGAAAENLRLNGLAAHVELQEGGVEELPGTFDVVMANLQAQPLIHLAAALKDKLARGGQLVLSGILNGQQQPIATAYRAQGLVPAAERSSGEWCLLHFSRDAS